MKVTLLRPRGKVSIWSKIEVLWILIQSDPELFHGSGIIALDPDPSRMKEQIN